MHKERWPVTRLQNVTNNIRRNISAYLNSLQLSIFKSKAWTGETNRQTNIWRGSLLTAYLTGVVALQITSNKVTNHLLVAQFDQQLFPTYLISAAVLVLTPSEQAEMQLTLWRILLNTAFVKHTADYSVLAHADMIQYESVNFCVNTLGDQLKRADMLF